MKRLLMICAISLLLSGCARSAAPHVVADLPAASGRNTLAWAPDGRRLLYIQSDKGFGPVMLLDLDHPDQPRALTSMSTHSLAFSPDGKAFAYIAFHPGSGRPESTVMVQPLAGGEPVDLFPHGGSVHGVSGALRVDRWVDERTVSYIEGMGTSIREIFLVDVPNRKLVLESNAYSATEFIWTADGSRLAGQMWGGPPHFWLWDRASGQFLKPAAPLPGETQWFEGWAPDRESVLFTAWTGGFAYWDEAASATLYRWRVGTGQVEKLVENAGRATTAEGFILYTRLGQEPELVVASAESGEVVWSEPLGRLADPVGGPPQWPAQPLVQDGYVAFAHADGQWYVSPLGRRALKPLVKGKDLSVIWAPGGRHLATLGDDPVRLQVLENPAFAR